MIATMTTAFLLGVFGFVVAHRLTTSLLRTRELADTVPVGRQQRTLALCLACLVPFAVGMFCAAFMIVTAMIWPPDGEPVERCRWPGSATTRPAMSSRSCWPWDPWPRSGGPLLGVAVARWAPFRGSALLGVVVLVVATAIPASDSGGAAGGWPPPGRCSSTSTWYGREDHRHHARARHRPGLGAGLGALPVRAGRRGSAAPRPGAPSSAAPGRAAPRRGCGRLLLPPPCHDRRGSGRPATSRPSHRGGVVVWCSPRPSSLRCRRPAVRHPGRAARPRRRRGVPPRRRRGPADLRHAARVWRRRAPGCRRLRATSLSRRRERSSCSAGLVAGSRRARQRASWCFRLSPGRGRADPVPAWRPAAGGAGRPRVVVLGPASA